MRLILWFFLALLLLVVLLVVLAVIFLLVRVRRIGRTVGTFECWARPDASSGWMSGMARFGSQDLQWFRLVGFYVGPQFRIPRAKLKISQPLNRHDGVVEVVVSADNFRRHLAMSSQWYNGLVSWNESGPPKPREEY